jgi:hypothetical protein
MHYKLTTPPGSCGSFPQTRSISVYVLWLESARPRPVEMRIEKHHPRAARGVDPRYTFSLMIHVLERRGMRSVTAARNRQARLRCVDQHSCGSGYFAPPPAAAAAAWPALRAWALLCGKARPLEGSASSTAVGLLGLKGQVISPPRVERGTASSSSSSWRTETRVGSPSPATSRAGTVTGLPHLPTQREICRGPAPSGHVTPLTAPAVKAPRHCHSKSIKKQNSSHWQRCAFQPALSMTSHSGS